VATNGGNIRNYEGTDKPNKAIPPFIAINTAAGTASEMTRFCILTNTSHKLLYFDTVLNVYELLSL
jgi:alcohol dehydrogenase